MVRIAGIIAISSLLSGCVASSVIGSVFVGTACGIATYHGMHKVGAEEPKKIAWGAAGTCVAVTALAHIPAIKLRNLEKENGIQHAAVQSRVSRELMILDERRLDLADRKLRLDKQEQRITESEQRLDSQERQIDNKIEDLQEQESKVTARLEEERQLQDQITKKLLENLQRSTTVEQGGCLLFQDGKVDI